MTTYFNGNKAKELYYNGQKIKEAWYNGVKVYNNITTRTISFNITGSYTRYNNILTINGINFSYKTTGLTGSIAINVGDAVTIVADGKSESYIRNSSNTNYILNRGITWLPQEFIMPDEDLSFDFYISKDIT